MNSCIDSVLRKPLGPTLDELKTTYEGHHIDFLKNDICDFIRSHSNDIISYKRELDITYNKDIPIDDCLRLYIAGKKSINPSHEMSDQLKEMEKEIWIVHEKDPNPGDDEIRFGWICRFGAIWREYRIMFIEYILYKEKDYFNSFFSTLNNS